MARYAVAVIAVGAAIGLRLLLGPVWGDRMPFTLMFGAVALSAWYGGRGPAVASVLLGGLAVAYFVLEPHGALAITQPDYRGELAVYLAISTLVAFVVDTLQRAQIRALRLADDCKTSEEWLHTTVHSIGDGVVATDRDGRVNLLNPVAEALTGWNTADAKGQPLELVFRIVNEYTRQPCETPVARAIREGRVVGPGNHTVLIAKDGTERPIEDSASPIRNAAGEIIGVVMVFRDGSEQRRAQLAERVAAQRLALALEAGQMGAWEWDLVTDRVWWSSQLEPIHGMEPGSFGGTLAAFQATVHPDDRARVEAALRHAIETAGEYNIEFRSLRPDGSIHWTGTKARVFLDEAGQPARLTGISMDVTDRREVEQALTDANRRKDEFLAMLAHELRNPLAPMRNAIEVMRLADGDADALVRAREMIQRQLQHMVRLVDDLLDVSRITRNRLELRRERIALQHAIESAVETSAAQMGSAHRELRIVMPSAPIYLDADLTRLAQVFANLLNNAVKYTEENGKISLVASVDDTGVVVTVRDDGVGVAPEDHERMFELFEQVGVLRYRNQAGLGIGLTLARRLVELHDGTLAVKSGGLGEGSEFTVRLPGLADAAPAIPVSKRSQPAQTRPLRILVADDNRDAAESMAGVLRLMGHEVHTAMDGEQAVRLAQQLIPEVVFLDIGMPVLDGYEVARLLRANAPTQRAMLVAVTGWGQDEHKRAAMDAGFDHHVVKPMDHAQLRALLDAAPRSG